MKGYRISKPILFIFLGIVIFLSIQAVLTPEWRYPHMQDKPADTLEEFDQLGEDCNIQAIFLGPSYTQNSIDPMKIYQETGIATYNLSSSGQPIGLSKFMLQKAFQKYSPKVVFLDSSRLFKSDFETDRDNTHYRYIIDSMPLDKLKIELASAYAQHFPKEEQRGRFLSSFFPIYDYHYRWTELTASDFMRKEKRNIFQKGYHLYCNIAGTDLSKEMIDETAEINQTGAAWIHSITSGVVDGDQYTDVLYNPRIKDESLAYLLQIKELCKANDAKLVLITIPSRQWPQYNDSAWTRINVEIVRELAQRYDIAFLDMCYDSDVGIDWYHDTGDGGVHLIYLGAQKVSSFLADYLQNDCGLSDDRCQDYEEDLAAYSTVSHVADLISTVQLTDYLEELDDWKDVTVFISADNDMMANLTPECKCALNAFGLQTNFDILSYSDSFLAVKEGGVVQYEASSNRLITREGILQNGASYTITSCGWRAGHQAKIIIDGVDYSRNNLGINIVVYDNASGLVLDSVTFNTFTSGDQSGKRSGLINIYLREYEEYIMKQDAKNGVLA